jgi:hypothetical protein
MGTLRIVRRILGVAFVAAASLACNSVLGLEEYEVRPIAADSGGSETSIDSSPTEDACWRADGFGNGQPCFACDASTSKELMNACTSNGCVHFDDRTRITGFDGAVPPPPDASIDEVAVTDSMVVVDPGLPLCSSLENAVYVIGSSALELAHKKIGAALLQNGKATFVYRKEPSCDGLNAILNKVPIRGIAEYYGTDPTAPAKSCRFADAGELMHIGLCDVFPERCIAGFTGLPADVQDSFGPIQVFMFATPKVSIEEVISRNAAYMVFGFAAASGVAPWIKGESILRRHPGSGTQQFLAAAIGLPVDVWRGVRVQGSGEMFNKLKALPGDGIGITSADVTDDFVKRPEIRTLAYQHTNQSCGFLPDTSRNSWDKRNVRDGHYYLWAPLHMFASVSGGAITHGPTRDTLNVLRGTLTLPGFDFIGTLKSSGLVPNCAMRVTRTGENGEVHPFSPSVPCHCAYEAAAPASTSSCSTCMRDEDCKSAGAPKCRFGFCEER